MLPRLLLMVLIFASPTLKANQFEAMFMSPGKLHQSHAKWNAECQQCHHDNKNQNTNLCLDCHDEIAADRNKNNGFHGQKKQRTQQCNRCHTEHQGSQAQITAWTIASFNHDSSGFKLEGSHEALNCSACHTEKSYRLEKTTCEDCHSKDTIHAQRISQQCQDCHNQKNWLNADFNHNQSDFKLKASHSKLSCQQCHVNQSFNQIETQCISCHLTKDIHNGRFGQQCSSCHNEKSWKKQNFNHNQDTEFSLKGKHKIARCNSCHKLKQNPEKLNTSCFSCHQDQDKHHKSMGKQCQTCHNTSSWSQTKFDHNSQTSFPLIGKHHDTHCENCHKTSALVKAEQCIDCHQSPHSESQSSDCLNCHTQQSWLNTAHFDHDLSKYPLIGLHNIVECEFCHQDSSFEITQSSCVDCHEQQHGKSYQASCVECHTPAGWDHWSFDHNQTNFELLGVHKQILCTDCHQADKTLQDSSCFACHQDDDKHKGRFGKKCQSCHISEDFLKIREDAFNESL